MEAPKKPDFARAFNAASNTMGKAQGKAPRDDTHTAAFRKPLAPPPSPPPKPVSNDARGALHNGVLMPGGAMKEAADLNNSVRTVRVAQARAGACTLTIVVPPVQQQGQDGTNVAMDAHQRRPPTKVPDGRTKPGDQKRPRDAPSTVEGVRCTRRKVCAVITRCTWYPCTMVQARWCLAQRTAARSGRCRNRS